MVVLSGGRQLFTWQPKNRKPIPSVQQWLDSEIRVIWDFQKAVGMIEGWHGDGNFARTIIMYCLLKTQGIIPVDWKKDLFLGALGVDDGIKVVMRSPTGWQGKLKFDVQRHKSVLKLPADYPRINQFSEWFTVEADKKYRVAQSDASRSRIYSGLQLLEGLRVRLKKNRPIFSWSQFMTQRGLDTINNSFYAHIYFRSLQFHHKLFFTVGLHFKRLSFSSTDRE